MKNLSTEIAGITFKNPIWVASGTFGWGEEYCELIDLNQLGAVVTKSITAKPREGNPPPRLVETPYGMLNSIGLQNPGIEAFIDQNLPFLSKFDTKIIVNIAGETTQEYTDLCFILDKISKVDAIEINISCPNVKKGGMTFGVDSKMTEEVIHACRRATKKPLIAKLTPNVTDITEIALAAERAGADAISAINTVLAMAIDIKTKKPKIAQGMAGLSGPAIKPIAIRCVWQIAQKVKIPIIGIGGIMDTDDVLEFFAAGAKAVQIGTANFVDPQTAIKIIQELCENY